MAIITGITGALTSWGSGSIHSQLAGTGTKPASLNITIEGDDYDSTGFSDAGIETHLKGLTAWSFEGSAQLLVPDHGASGLVTFAAGYTTNLDHFSVEASRQEHKFAAFQGTFYTFVFGKMGWRGDFGGALDDTTAMALPSNSSEPATATFKYQEKGATDNTLSGSIFTNRASIGIAPTAINSIEYSYIGSGNLTHSTPSAGAGFLPSGAVALTAPEAVVLTASNGRTFTGTAAWTRFSIAARVGQLTEVRFTGRGTTALVPA